MGDNLNEEFFLNVYYKENEDGLNNSINVFFCEAKLTERDELIIQWKFKFRKS